MTFGPRASSSPVWPGSTSCPSGSTIRMSTEQWRSTGSPGPSGANARRREAGRGAARLRESVALDEGNPSVVVRADQPFRYRCTPGQDEPDAGHVGHRPSLGAHQFVEHVRVPAEGRPDDPLPFDSPEEGRAPPPADGFLVAGDVVRHDDGAAEEDLHGLGRLTPVPPTRKNGAMAIATSSPRKSTRDRKLTTFAGHVAVGEHQPLGAPVVPRGRWGRYSRSSWTASSCTWRAIRSC